VARFKLSLNEGSLVRRTVLHVGAFVLGTAAFLALASFLLVTMLRGLLPSDKSASGDDDPADDSAQTAPTGGKATTRPPRKKRGAATPVPTASEDEE